MAIYFGSQRAKKLWYGSQEVRKAWIGAEVFYENYPESLEDWTWGQISEVAAKGEGQNYHSIGAEKKVTLTTGETITLQIEDFDHDDKADGSGRANITFGLKSLPTGTYQMNGTSTNVGSWNASSMRTSTMALLLSQLPADLRAAIKPVTKRTTAGNGATTIQATTDSLWLFSLKEVGMATTTPGYADEGNAYPLYINNASRIKYKSGIAAEYWLRSPNLNNVPMYNLVVTTGGGGTSGAVSRYSVCFGFCI